MKPMFLGIMILIQLNEQTARLVRDYGYEPDDAHLLKLDSCLELMDFTICMYEITGGGPPFWFSPDKNGVCAATERTDRHEGKDVTHINLTDYSPQ